MLSDADISYIRECMDDVAGDIEEPITYRQYTGTVEGDQVMGTAYSADYNDLSITASVRELSLEEVQASGGTYVLGDIQVKIRQTVLANQPAYADRIKYLGASFKPKSIGHAFLGGTINWVIRAGKE